MRREGSAEEESGRLGCGLPRRALPPPRTMTGRERRWLDAQHGLIKQSERLIDRVLARHVYPHLFGLWHPYCWQLPRRLEVATATLAPPRWPRGAGALRVLHLSDIHTGAFLRPAVLQTVLEQLMRLRPDLVAITGDIVEGWLDDLDGFLPALGVLRHAPLGAWFCFGNHDYFTEATDAMRMQLASIGITTLRNETRALPGGVVIGGIDDRTLGAPDWDALTASGAPHLLLAHQPDDFYEAERRGVALVLAGHTHGGQIRFPNRSPIIRQSRFYLDEGLYAFGGALLEVTRGLGAVGLPWRAGAAPEAVLLEVGPPGGEG
jgi:uncharacterized protein